MRSALILRSFLPFATRFFYRHPTKLGRLRQHWLDYVGRFTKMAELTGADIDSVDRAFYELECEEPLFRELNGLTGMPMHPIVYYALIRLLQPRLVVETGVNNGFSTRFLLLAMERNGCGLLHSIDMPIPQEDVRHLGKEIGWLVPGRLRARWQFHLGDARELLPKLLQELGAVDMFIHDSLHTHDHMLFEYQTAWPHIRAGGILLSDDTDFNAAFPEFAASIDCPTVMFNFRVGAIRKPAAAAKTS